MSEDGENITCGASGQAAYAVVFESANHTELLWPDNSVPPYPVCGEREVGYSSMLAPDCMKWTSGDQCKVMCAADYTSSAGTLTGTRDDGNGSVASIGVLPNCPAALCAIDGVPSGTSHDCDGIAFLESCFANCSDGYAPVDVTSATLSCGFNGVLVMLAKPCLARAVRSWTTTPWRARIDPP